MRRSNRGIVRSAVTISQPSRKHSSSRADLSRRAASTRSSHGCHPIAGSRLALLVVLAAVLSACGGNGNGVSYVPASTRSALEKAGWTARSGAGMAPIAGGRQIGWLDAVSPTGAKVSLQFLESSKLANAELSAIHHGVDGSKPDPSFAGVTIANVLAFATPNGRAPLAAEVVTSLTAVLKSTKHATGAY